MSATLTIRGVSEETQRILKHRAVDHGHSMETELRQIINSAAATPEPTPEKTNADRLFEAFAEIRQAQVDLGISLPYPLERVRDFPREISFS